VPEEYVIITNDTKLSRVCGGTAVKLAEDDPLRYRKLDTYDTRKSLALLSVIYPRKKLYTVARTVDRLLKIAEIISRKAILEPADVKRAIDVSLFLDPHFAASRISF